MSNSVVYCNINLNVTFKIGLLILLKNCSGNNSFKICDKISNSDKWQKIYKSKIKFFGKIDNPNLKQGSPKFLRNLI